MEKRQATWSRVLQEEERNERGDMGERVEEEMDFVDE